jgi:N-acetylglucosamine-6-phosphate deacetylase
MDKDVKAINRISQNLLKEGTTSFLATTLTDTGESIIDALKVLGNAKPAGAKMQGIHLEGPFINKRYKGAQDEASIIKGNPLLFDQFQKAASGKIKLVTLAPECQDKSFLEYLTKQDLILSIGHSDASVKDFKQAYKFGIKRITHCFNALRLIHHREIGALGMALLNDDVMCEIIADGNHVSYETLQLLFKIKKDQLILITDSMRAKGMENGRYLLGKANVLKSDDGVYTEDFKLAGSILSMNQALKNMTKYITNDLTQLTKMLSQNPAKSLKIMDVGEIKKGYKADLVFLDEAYNVKMTMVNGQILYQR